MLYQALHVLVVSFVLLLSNAALAAPYELSYGGRLTESTGKSVDGPVNLRVTFFRSISGNDQVAVTIPDFSNVTLQDGIFQIALSLNAADFHTVFNGTDRTFIQVEDLSHSVIYPRQKLTAVPYALKVPVDGESITYNANGELSLGNGSNTLKLPNAAGPLNKVLKSDGAGALVWADDLSSGGAGTITTTEIQDGTLTNADISATAAISYLKISGLGGAASKNVGTAANEVAAGNHSHADATTSVAGFLSTADKTKLDSVASGAGVDTNAKTLCGDGEFLRGEATTTCKTSAQIVSDGGGVTTSDTGTVTGTLIANGTIADADISGTAAIAGTKINPDFGSQNITTTGIIYGNLGIISCPSGFTLIGAGGKRGSFCVDTNQRTAATFLNAKSACNNLSLTEGIANLCSHDEWFYACNSGLATDMTGDSEWVADLDTNAFGIVAGSSSCSSLGSNTIGTSNPFRCCVR